MGFLDFLAAAGPIISGAGAAVGGIASANAQADANQQNIGLAREQMAFQERMSNSAYQRATDDMRKAGINPMMAYSQGGASTPPGALAETAPASPVTGLADALKTGVASALQVREQNKALEMKDADIALAKATEGTKKTEAVLNTASAKGVEKQMQLANEQIRQTRAGTLSTLEDVRGKQLTNMRTNLGTKAFIRATEADMKEAENRYTRAAIAEGTMSYDELMKRINSIPLLNSAGGALVK